MQPVSGVLSTQKARTPGWDSQHLYTGDALLTRLDTACAEASCASSSELSPCSMRFATIRRRLCCPAVRGVLSCYSSDIPLLQILCNPSRSVLYCHSACISLEKRVFQLFLWGSIVWALVFGLASVLRLLGVSFYRVCFFFVKAPSFEAREAHRY